MALDSFITSPHRSSQPQNACSPPSFAKQVTRWNIELGNSMFKSFFILCFVLALGNVIAAGSSQDDCGNQILFMDKEEMPLAFQNQEGWYSALLESNKSKKLIYSYSNSINAFAATLSPAEIDSLRMSRGFVAAMKDRPMRLYSTRTPHFLGLNYAYGAWPASNFGDGVIIGIVDTGIWPDSPSFTDEGMGPVPLGWKGGCENETFCNKKIIGSRSFIRGVVSVRDRDGHGTHSASIAAGNYVDGASSFGYASGTARGMAPRAALAIYRAISDDISACVSDVLAAMDQAIADGVDILSMSVGFHDSDLVPEENPLAPATFAAMEKGIFVSMAAGNFGPEMKTLGNDFPWATTVGAGTLDRTFRGTIMLGNGVELKGFSLYNGKQTYGRLPISHLEDCDDYLAPEIPNKVIVCRPSSRTIQTDYVVQITSDPAGALEDFGPGLYDIATMFVSPAIGKLLEDYINLDKEPTASLYFGETTIGITPAPLVWDGSSRGPSTSYPSVLKPDIIAPGVMVLGSWIPYTLREGIRVFNNTGLTIESGTSVACPHVAGVAALLKKAHPEWTPAAIRSAIMTTADIMDNSDNPILDQNNRQNATPLAMGAGQINPNRALDPGLVYDLSSQDYIGFLCSLNWTRKQIQAVVRANSFDCLLSRKEINYPSFIFNIDPNSSSPTSIVFNRVVTNVGEDTSLYFADFAPIKGFKLSVQPGYLEFQERFQKLEYNLTIEAPAVIDNPVSTGYLIWVNRGGRGQVVRSPIVVTTQI